MVFEVSQKELEEWKNNGYTGRVFKTRRECEEFERKERSKRPYKTAEQAFDWLKKTRPDLPPELCSALVCMEFPGNYPTFHLNDDEKKNYMRILEEKAQQISKELENGK